MALNMADLFEHAVDAFPDRVALIFGDRQVTYRRARRRGQPAGPPPGRPGVGPGDHVGLYARNSIETVETLLATIKLRAAPSTSTTATCATNWRITCGTPTCPPWSTTRTWLRSWTPSCPPDCPAWRSARTLRRGPIVRPGPVGRVGSTRLPARAAPTTSTSSTPGAPPGIRRASCGATRTSGARSAAASTSSPASRWKTSGRSPAQGAEDDGMVRMAPAPLIHGAAMVATLACLFGGDTAVIMPKFDPRRDLGARCSGTRSTCCRSSATRWPGR